MSTKRVLALEKASEIRAENCMASLLKYGVPSGSEKVLTKLDADRPEKELAIYPVFVYTDQWEHQRVDKPLSVFLTALCERGLTLLMGQASSIGFSGTERS